MAKNKGVIAMFLNQLIPHADELEMFYSEEMDDHANGILGLFLWALVFTDIACGRYFRALLLATIQITAGILLLAERRPKNTVVAMETVFLYGVFSYGTEKICSMFE